MNSSPLTSATKIRAAYGRAAGSFLAWCEDPGPSEFRELQPLHVAAYIEQLDRERSGPTVKQHLACLRMLFDWLVTGQALPANPAHSVRGPAALGAAGSHRCERGIVLAHTTILRWVQCYVPEIEKH